MQKLIEKLDKIKKLSGKRKLKGDRPHSHQNDFKILKKDIKCWWQYREEEFGKMLL